MTPRDFCYWLQGAVELGGLSDHLTGGQPVTVLQHISLVPPINKPVSEFSKAEILVHRIQVLETCKVHWWEPSVWQELVAQLNGVFEHQLNHEVPSTGKATNRTR